MAVELMRARGYSEERARLLRAARSARLKFSPFHGQAGLCIECICCMIGEEKEPDPLTRTYFPLFWARCKISSFLRTFSRLCLTLIYLTLSVFRRVGGRPSVKFVFLEQTC